MLTIIDLFNDNAFNLDPDMLKAQLASKQDSINKKKADLKKITVQLEPKNNESIKEINNFSSVNFKEFLNTISDNEKKNLFHFFIKEVHVTNGDRLKDRLNDDVIYKFNLKDLKTYSMSSSNGDFYHRPIKTLMRIILGFPYF